MYKIFITIILLVSSVTAVNIDSLLVKSIGGVKGYEALKNLEIITTEGTVILNGISGKFKQIIKMPDKLYIEINMEDFSLIQGYDGITAWGKDLNGSYTEITGYEKNNMLSTLYFDSFSNLSIGSVPGAYNYIGLVNYNNDEFHQIDFYPLNLDTVSIYFDNNTGLRAISMSKLDNLNTITTFSDYRTINDILFPFYLHATVESANLNTDFSVKTIQINQKISDSIFNMPSQKPSNFFFPPESSKVSVNIDYKLGHLRIPVILNGKRKLWMILDSGASSTIYHKPAIEDLELKVVGTIPAKGIGGYDDAELVRVDSLKVGEIVLKNKLNGSLNMSGLNKSTPNNDRFGGILGYDFLSEFPTLIDYNNSIITFYNPDSFEPLPNGIEIPFSLTMQVPTVVASINGISGQFIVDLGNAFGLIIHKPFYNQNKLENIFENIKETDSKLKGIGKATLRKSANATDFRMGKIKIDTLKVLIPESSGGISGSFEIAGNIGNLLLENYKILFDYKNLRLILYQSD